MTSTPKSIQGRSRCGSGLVRMVSFGVLYYEAMRTELSSKSRVPQILGRAVIEVSFIIFLFYANLLMGEFTASNERGRTLLTAVRDMVTVTNFCIALVTAVIGYFVFEFLRKKL